MNSPEGLRTRYWADLRDIFDGHENVKALNNADNNGPDPFTHRTVMSNLLSVKLWSVRPFVPTKGMSKEEESKRRKQYLFHTLLFVCGFKKGFLSTVSHSHLSSMSILHYALTIMDQWILQRQEELAEYQRKQLGEGLSPLSPQSPSLSTSNKTKAIKAKTKSFFPSSFLGEGVFYFADVEDVCGADIAVTPPKTMSMTDGQEGAKTNETKCGELDQGMKVDNNGSDDKSNIIVSGSSQQQNISLITMNTTDTSPETETDPLPKMPVAAMMMMNATHEIVETVESNDKSVIVVEDETVGDEDEWIVLGDKK